MSPSSRRGKLAAAARANVSPEALRALEQAGRDLYISGGKGIERFLACLGRVEGTVERAGSASRAASRQGESRASSSGDGVGSAGLSGYVPAPLQSNEGVVVMAGMSATEQRLQALSTVPTRTPPGPAGPRQPAEKENATGGLLGASSSSAGALKLAGARRRKSDEPPPPLLQAHPAGTAAPKGRPRGGIPMLGNSSSSGVSSAPSFAQSAPRGVAMGGINLLADPAAGMGQTHGGLSMAGGVLPTRRR